MPTVHKDFNPNIFHPFFFIRRGLLNSVSALSPQLRGNLMDFGAGSKPYRSLFDVESYIGVDYDSEGHPHSAEQIDVFYDGKVLPFSDAQFDSVFSSEVFEHIFNLPEIVPEISRVMKPEGKLLITCPFVWIEHEIPVDYARYTRFALSDILEKNGFKVLEVRKSGNFITTLFQMAVVYSDQYLSPKRLYKFLPFKVFFRTFLIAFPNAIGLFFNWLLPKKNDLYLNTVILAEKI